MDGVLQDGNSKKSLNHFLGSIKPALEQLEPNQLGLMRINFFLLILHCVWILRSFQVEYRRFVVNYSLSVQSKPAFSFSIVHLLASLGSKDSIYPPQVPII